MRPNLGQICSNHGQNCFFSLDSIYSNVNHTWRYQNTRYTPKGFNFQFLLMVIFCSDDIRSYSLLVESKTRTVQTVVHLPYVNQVYLKAANITCSKLTPKVGRFHQKDACLIFNEH